MQREFLSWDIKVSQEIRIVRKNVRNKNFLFSKGKSNSAKNLFHTLGVWGENIFLNKKLYFKSEKKSKKIDVI